MAVENEDVSRRYFIHYVAGVAAPGARVLDFGCGAGRLVGMLQEAGFEAYGCDIRWPGANYEWDGHAGDRLRYFESGGRLPFADDTFDVVVSDQVFEHVKPLEASIAEIERVTKPGGVMYHHFPSGEVWREGHIGIPFAHRLPDGRLRLAYATLLRRLGFGIFKDDRPPREWAAEKLAWIDEWTEYRSPGELHRAFRRNATVTHREIEYCRFRAGDRRWLRLVIDRPPLEPAIQQAFRRLAFMALECRAIAPSAPAADTDR